MKINAHIQLAFATQADSCAQLGSPFTAQICSLFPKIIDRQSRFGRCILDWPETAQQDALPLRVAGALHALKRSGAAPELAAFYPPHKSGPETLAISVQAAIATHDAWLCAFLNSPPQTNEVARSSALLGMALRLSDAFKMPLALYELGASAGLNLAFDHYAYDFGTQNWGDPEGEIQIAAEWRGHAPPLEAPLEIASRAGCDRWPIDPTSETDVERQLAYIWADQDYRITRTRAALAAAADMSLKVEQADAADWIETQLAQPAIPGRVRVIFHSIFWQYLPDETKKRITAAIEQAGATANHETPLVWMRMEGEGNPAGASLTLRKWPDGSTHMMGIADFHGRWVEWA